MKVNQEEYEKIKRTEKEAEKKRIQEEDRIEFTALIKKIRPDGHWEECCVCRRKVTKEDMWKSWRHRVAWDPVCLMWVGSYWHYLCFDCCKDENTAYGLFLKANRERNSPPVEEEKQVFGFILNRPKFKREKHKWWKCFKEKW